MTVSSEFPAPDSRSAVPDVEVPGQPGVPESNPFSAPPPVASHAQYSQPGYAQPGYVQPGYAQPGYAQLGAPGLGQPNFPTYTAAPVGSIAALGARFGARLIDSIIMIALVYVPFFAYGVAVGASDPSVTDSQMEQSLEGGLTILLYGLGFVVVWAYEISMTAIWGATLGKMVMGLKIVTVRATKPDFGAATGRWALPAAMMLVPIIGWLGTLLCYLSTAWDPQKQGWHDKAAGTFVVRSR